MTYLKLFFFVVISVLLISCNESSTDSSIQFLDKLLPSDRVWAHRVNTLGNGNEKLKEFYGIEIDVFYNKDDKTFAVKHDEDQDGTDLELFLDSVLVQKRCPIWIDYKNMNVDTEKGIDRIYEILKNRNLLDVCFVESYYLASLKKANDKLLTSFWFGSAEIPKTREEQDSLYHAKYKSLNLSEFDMLSSPHHMFDFFSYYFPNTKCNYWLSGSLDSIKIERLKMIAEGANTGAILIDGKVNYLK